LVQNLGGHRPPLQHAKERIQNAEAQTGKKQSGSLGHRAGLHGHEFFLRPDQRQKGDAKIEPGTQTSGIWLLAPGLNPLAVARFADNPYSTAGRNR
jgi:hypothetical protein